MTSPLPHVAEGSWFETTPIRPDLELLVEPHVDEFLRANLWLLSGERSSVLIDCGLGIAPLAPLVYERTGRECAVILTHGHLDHAGAAHEFMQRWGHPADEVREVRHLSLASQDHAADLGLAGEELGASGDWLVARIPTIDFDPRGYQQLPAPLTRHLSDGDRVELGGLNLEVLHLPGHTPGSIALYDPERRELYSGDVVYDDQLLDTLPESNVAAYRDSLSRLRSLPVDLVRPGHGDCFDGKRLRAIIDEYLLATSPRAGRG